MSEDLPEGLPNQIKDALREHDKARTAFKAREQKLWATLYGDRKVNEAILHTAIDQAMHSVAMYLVSLTDCDHPAQAKVLAALRVAIDETKKCFRPEFLADDKILNPLTYARMLRYDPNTGVGE